MNHFNPQSEIAPTVLATDLDGTLIPLPDYPENKDDLILLKEALAAKDRSKLGLNAPPNGLYFVEAIYPDHERTTP